VGKRSVPKNATDLNSRTNETGEGAAGRGETPGKIYREKKKGGCKSLLP